MQTQRTLSTRPDMNVPPCKPPAAEHLLNMTPLQRVESAARRLRSAEAQVADWRLASPLQSVERAERRLRSAKALVADRRLALHHEIQLAIGTAVSRLRPSQSHTPG